MAHACNPSTPGGRGRQISEFKASLVYRVSSRIARAIQRNPVWGGGNKNKPPKKQKTMFSDNFIHTFVHSKMYILNRKQISLKNFWKAFRED